MDDATGRGYDARGVNGMGKIVTKSEFHSDVAVQYAVRDGRVTEAETDCGNDFLSVEEIPVFITWLQSEYDRVMIEKWK